MRRLRAGFPVVVPARELGVDAVDTLADQRVVQPGFPPDSGDSLVLEHEGEAVAFSVFKVGNGYLCREERDANPRTLELPAAELIPFKLNRVEFFRLIASDLGVSPEIVPLHPGIWELGRRSIPGHGRVKVLAVEAGHRTEQLQLALHKESFKVVCVLGCDAVPSAVEIPEKLIVTGRIEATPERFLSSVFEDVAAIVEEPEPGSYVDLDCMPPVLSVCGREFKLPMRQSSPTDGCQYLAHLFDQPNKPITCRELYCKSRPDLAETAGVNHWTDAALDEQAEREFKQSLAAARMAVDEAESDSTMPEGEIQRLRTKLDELLQQKGKLLNLSGKSRPLAGGDTIKARQKVRKALQVVIRAVTDQDSSVGAELEEALGEGDPVTFRPPPEWNL